MYIYVYIIYIYMYHIVIYSYTIIINNIILHDVTFRDFLCSKWWPVTR